MSYQRTRRILALERNAPPSLADLSGERLRKALEGMSDEELIALAHEITDEDPSLLDDLSDDELQLLAYGE